MKGKAGAAGGKAKAHQPAPAGAAAAQAAAVPPGNEVASQAAGAQVEEMGTQQPGTFDRKAFIAAVKKAIDAAAPKNLEEADDFKGSGKAAQVKDEVGASSRAARRTPRRTSRAPPTRRRTPPRPVPSRSTPLAPEQAGAATPSVGAAAAMPGPRPPEETDLSAGPAEVDEEMEREGVTEEQLAKANEPDFSAALDARQTAKEHSARRQRSTAPRSRRCSPRARTRPPPSRARSSRACTAPSSRRWPRSPASKGEAKSQDEVKRAKVAARHPGDLRQDQDRRHRILTALDGKVDAAFTRGEASAPQQFEDYVGEKMAAYKDDRYSGIFGGARWLKDKLFGMPGAVNAFYTRAATRT